MRAATFGRGVWETSLSLSGVAGEEKKDGVSIRTISSEGIYRLHTTSPGADEEYLIFNYLGERVKGGNVKGSETEIDLRGQPNGLYYLALKSEGYKELRKMVKVQ